MKLADLLRVLDDLAPLGGAEDWDVVGLQVGDPAAEVTRAVLCVDYTPAVLEAARAEGAGLVVAYHPPMFKALGRLVGGADAPWKQRLMVETVAAGVAVYSPHTALDVAAGGTNDALCDALAAGEPSTRQAIVPAVRDFYKVVLFVPTKAAAALRAAMAGAGAGGMGRYRACSFEAAGTGRFEPLDGAEPAVGEVGRDEAVAELRLEMRCPAEGLAPVLAAARAAHPYEEPAIDVIPIAAQRDDGDPVVGAGRVLTLDRRVIAEQLAARVDAYARIDGVRNAWPTVTVGAHDSIRTIAVCVGAGGSLFEGVEADAYVTGELRHHDQLDLVQRGKAVVLSGHTELERPYLPRYAERLRAAAPEVDFDVTFSDVQ